MEDPYRSPSSPSTQRPPPKRWYVLFGNASGPWAIAVVIGIASIIPAVAFLRRGHNPPKDALVFGGDDA